MTKHAIIPILAILASAAVAAAQCVPQWSAAGPSDPGQAYDLTVYDVDGPGPARPVLVGAGGWGIWPADRHLVASFDGRAWRQMAEGAGPEAAAKAICVANTTGVGSPAPGLYLGGAYFLAGVATPVSLSRWNGSEWNVVGGWIAGIDSLLMFDEDGSGPNEPDLFVGGGIHGIGGVEWPGLARWDGTGYSLVGGSLAKIGGGVPIAAAMTIFDDDGPGPRPPALYVAGSFQTAGGLVVNNIARWDGKNWEALGLGLSSGVRALAVYDADGDGPGPPMLYADGPFRMTPGGNFSNANLSRWDGQQWSEAPNYTGGRVTTLAVHDDDGIGPNRESLFIGGFFPSIQGVPSPGIIRWDGSRWHSMDGGVGGITGAHPNAMGIFDEDGDPATPPGLYVGGSFFTAGGISSPGLARWGCPLTTCYADCEASTGLNRLDIFDFLCFQNLFVNADPYACDCDTATGPATCDIFDFLCFQNAFVSGCP
jgi:hypothetical protein